MEVCEEAISGTAATLHSVAIYVYSDLGGRELKLPFIINVTTSLSYTISFVTTNISVRL